jgi:hypothetical protein
VTAWRSVAGRAGAGLLLAGLALAAPARADESPEAAVRALVARDLAASGQVAEEHPFAWVVDPSTVQAGRASLSYSFGLASGGAPDRPVPIEIAPSATSHQIGLSYGVTDRLAPFATATLVQGHGTSLAAGVKLQLTPTDAPLRAAVLGAVLREGASGQGGGWLRLAGSWDTGPVRLAATVHAEKVLAPGRDAVDLMAMAGTSVRLAGGVRVGAEYVGQDFEASDAEGGARHLVGPNLAFDVDRGRVQFVVATGFGLTPRSPRATVKAGLSGAF